MAIILPFGKFVHCSVSSDPAPQITFFLIAEETA